MRRGTRIASLTRVPAARRLLAGLLAAGALAAPAGAERGTSYDGSGAAWVRYTSRPAFDDSVAMTIEAWVYRRDAGRCETVVSHDFIASYWLGFRPGLRFYRSGRTWADATAAVPAGRWTHVAASYDGATVRFYVDGEPAGSAPLGNDGAGVERPLVLGADPSGMRLNFWGALAEVRLWSVVRPPAAIRAERFLDLRSAPGLVAVFGDGGAGEALTGDPGLAGRGTRAAGAQGARPLRVVAAVTGGDDPPEIRPRP